MRVGQAAAVGVQRQRSARFGVPGGDERAGLALAREPQRLEPVDGHVRERVVDHQVVHVGHADARLGEGGPPGQPERLGLGEVQHLRDHRRLRRLAGAENMDRGLGEIRGPVRRGDHQGAAAVRDQAAFEQVERVGDHPGGEHVLDRERVAVGGARVLGGPAALGHGYVGQLLVGQPVLLHVAQHRDGERRGRAENAVRRLELPGRRGRPETERRSAHPGPPRLAVRDQHRPGVPGPDGRGRVTHVQQERGAAHAGAVDPGRREAERVCHLHRARRGDRGDAVDVAQRQARVGHRVQRALHVQLQRAVTRQLAEPVGLGRARDDDAGLPAHGVTGPNTGRLTSPRGSKLTCSGMSSSSASGVAGSPVMLVIIRGPSSSSTTAIA